MIELGKYGQSFTVTKDDPELFTVYFGGYLPATFANHELKERDGVLFKGKFCLVEKIYGDSLVLVIVTNDQEDCIVIKKPLLE